MILCDTNIFIEAFKNNPSATDIDLIEQYSKSHGLQIPDALIASTAICHDMELLTYNVKDFKFIKGIKLFSDN
jgi:predicted nucleic acid-binding protein